MFVYDDGKGSVTECQELPGNGVLLEYILDDYIYYYDSGYSLFREKDGQVESVIEFQHYGGALRYYIEDGIYYIDIDEDEEKSYIGKSEYDGTDSHKLYKLNVAVDQVKIYLQTYAGGLYNKFYQMDETGDIVRQWDSDEINRKLENK